MLYSWFRKRLNRVVHSTLAERNAARKKSRRIARTLRVELFEDRLALAFTAFDAGILTVDVNYADEAAILTNDGTNISLTSNQAITGVGGSFSTADVTKIIITNVNNNAGQSIVFAGTAVYSLSGGLASSGVETNTFNVGVTATGAASISVTAPQSIIVNANLTGGTGGTTLLGQGLAVLNTDGVTVQSAAVVSATGNVSVTGQGGSGSGGNNHGVYVVLSGRITAGGTGTVTVSGTGGSGSGDNNYGVYAFNPNNAAGNSTITSGGGTVTVSGTGGSGSGSLNHGVFVRGIGSAISSGGGNVNVTGQGGGGGGSGNTNYGVYLLLRGNIKAGGSGTTTVSGTGGSSSGGGNTGVYMNQTSSDIRSSGGNVSVTGQGGSGGGDNNWGVYLTGQAVIGAGGSGTVTVSGTGGSGSGSLNHGVYVGGFGSSNASITSGGGSVSVTGQGGGGSGAGGSNFGVHVYSSSEISAGGSGTVTVSGTGGSGSGDDNNGVVVNGINSVTNGLPLDNPAWQGLSGITSGGGNVSVTGEGGAGSGDRNTGVVVSGGGGVGVDIRFVRGKISAGGSGTVTVSGTGGSGSGSGHYGVYVKDSTRVKITSGGGRISVTGTGTANSEGVRLEDSGTITSGSNAPITVTADSVNILAGSTLNSGSGTTTIQTRTAGTQIDLGGTDMLSGTLTLGLTDAELDQITAGTIQVGNASSGAITVSAAVAPTGTSNLSLTTGANVIDGNALAGSDITVATISIVASTGISTSGNPLEVDASTFANVQTATGGIYIDIQDSGDVGHTVTSASATTSGDVVFTASTGGGTNTYVFNSVTVANGNIDLSKSVGGNIHVGTLNAAGTAGKTISVNVGSGNADSISHLGGTTIQTNDGQIALVANRITLGGSSITSGSNAPITVTADSVNILAGSTINSGSGTTTIQTRTAGTQIDLGGADVLLGTLTLGLTDTELDQITAGTIQVGNASSGAITVSAAVAPAGTSNLSLTTGANVIDGNALAGSDITVATISIVASTGISTSGNPLEVNANTFANVQTATGGIYIDIQDSGDVGHTVTSASATTSGDVVFTASTGGGTNTYVFNSVTVANGNIDLSKSVGGNIHVGTLNAAGTAGKTISVNVGSGNADSISHLGGTTIQTNDGQIALVANQMTLGGSSITSGSNAAITVTADSVNILAGSTINSGSGTTTIQTRTAGTQINLGGADVLLGTLTLGLTNAELDQITAGTIQVGNASSGAITVSAAITLTGTSNLSLTTDNATSSAISDGTVGLGGNLITVSTLTLTAPSGGIDATFDATRLNTTSSGTQFLQEANSVTISTSGLTAGSNTITLGGGTFSLGGSDRIHNSTNVNVSGATFDIGGFSDTVNTLTLTSGSISGTGGVLTSTNTIQTKSGSVSAILAGANGLTQSTGGSTTLSGTNTYTGVTTVTNGTLLVNGSLASGIALAGGILGGSGTVAGSVSSSAGTIAPGNSPGILNTGNVNYTGGNLNIEINGSTPGNTASDHDQLNVTGTVALGTGIARLNLSGTYTTIMPTDSFVIIKNDGSDDTTGYFVGLPEGSPIAFNTKTMYVTYKGGDGNDVVLTTSLVKYFTTREDTPKSFALSDFLNTNVRNVSLVSITISSLNLASGDSLTLAGVPVSIPLTIHASIIPYLVYTPAANANGVARSKFTFKVNCAEFVNVEGTMSINVTQVNDAPIRSAGSPAAINVNEDAANATAVTLGLAGLNYGPGGGNDESTQNLTYKLNAIPSFITVWLADGTTQVPANSSLTLTQLQGLKYKTLANGNGTGNLTWIVQDNGGTANGGIDSLPQSLSITVNAINDLPNAQASSVTTLEDSARAFAVSNFLYADVENNPLASITIAGLTLASGDTLKLKGVAVKAPLTISAANIPNIVYTPAANANGAGRSWFTFKVNDVGLGTVVATMSINVTPVNDSPIRSAGSPAAINVKEDAANATAVTLGLTGLNYGPGGGSYESTQTLTYKINAIPSFITAWLADGTTQVPANSSLTLTQFKGLKYKTLANANGTGSLTWTVQDNGGTANGGIDSLPQSLSITVNAINDAPIQTGTFPAAINVNKNSANTNAVSLGLSALNYGPGGGGVESSQTLSYKITAIPSFITVWRTDGTKQVLVNNSLSLADLQGLRYKTVSNAVGTGNLTWTVKDNGGIANGGVDTLLQNRSITVASNLELSGRPASNPTVGPQDSNLTIGVLHSMAEHVKSLWSTAGFDIAILSNLQIVIADLPGGTLGYALGSVVTIDRDAAGHGWFIDPTPYDSVEFDHGDAVVTQANHHIDLLSVLSHEVGHVLGLEHDDPRDVMEESIAIGKRRLPTHDHDVSVPTTSLVQSIVAVQSRIAMDSDGMRTVEKQTSYVLQAAQVDKVYANWSNGLPDSNQVLSTPSDPRYQNDVDEGFAITKKKRLLPLGTKTPSPISTAITRALRTLD